MWTRDASRDHGNAGRLAECPSWRCRFRRWSVNEHDGAWMRARGVGRQQAEGIEARIPIHAFPTANVHPALLAAVATDGYHGEEVAQVRRLTRPVDDGRQRAPRWVGTLPSVMTRSFRMFVLLRHAHAVNKRAWSRPDRERPLSERGFQQAEALVEPLSAVPLRRLLSSPALRCRQTLDPLAHRLGLAIESTELLDPDVDASLVSELAEDPGSMDAVLCTHGETLAALLGHWQARGRIVLTPPTSKISKNTTQKSGGWLSRTMHNCRRSTFPRLSRRSRPALRSSARLVERAEEVCPHRGSRGAGHCRNRFAYVLNYQIITGEGATVASTVTYLVPVVAIILGVGPQRDHYREHARRRSTDVVP